MNTNENWRDEHDRKYQQWESDKAVISDKSRTFYALVAEKYHGVYPGPVLAQQYFRMLWLGEYLRQKYNWHHQFHEISPQMALKYALLKQYGEKFTDIDALTQEEMSLTLTDYWSEFMADKTWKSKRYAIEKALDSLDFWTPGFSSAA
ncbi:TPA: hypothetical protein PNH35_000363 [Salmonella enterica]|uniref:Uncharacterized protein n=1 Tax=Salmonella enterica TaxID=28901 RepID=A0A5U5DTQ4_SALER|nr:hypothetical protein [Salmonella enterica]ECC2919596.1 hypothetical protein [Salmonella enterica subsp. enterica]EDI4629816.1 hypothetical protein [Salmonella enterica subsp. enterica serovar Poona]EDT1742900.1 hypothetical protein [Salmonella enterica subsp. enterica serovar O rough]EEH3933651.1 hypothetical protein [Salmonella enterica subsp. enterica serovar 4,[5],12:i:-]EAR4810863.1 hypothetical protein [Salmonella enterica]